MRLRPSFPAARADDMTVPKDDHPRFRHDLYDVEMARLMAKGRLGLGDKIIAQLEK